MSGAEPTRDVMARAGRRALYHLLQAVVEGLKAVEAVIEEVGNLSDRTEESEEAAITRIEIE